MAHILVVDDDQVLQRWIEAVLRKAGHTTVIAENGYSALEKLSREVFQLIISDANMPGGLSGFSLVSTIKNDPTLRHIPVIFLTGRGKKEDIVLARQAGVSEYLIKPVTTKVLSNKVDEVVNRLDHPKPFISGEVTAGGIAEFHLRIIHLSSTGVDLLSPVLLPINFKVKMTSDLFANIGLATPPMKVSSCRPFKLGDEAFLANTIFYDLSDVEKKRISDWLGSGKNSPKNIAS